MRLRITKETTQVKCSIDLGGDYLNNKTNNTYDDYY